MKRISFLLVFLVFAATLPLLAQQKGQYLPGQYGLNAGVLPDPGFTYANIDLNYDTNTFNNSSGTAVPPKPRLNLWVIENIFYYVVDTKFLGGYRVYGHVPSASQWFPDPGAIQQQRQQLWPCR